MFRNFKTLTLRLLHLNRNHLVNASLLRHHWCHSCDSDRSTNSCCYTMTDCDFVSISSDSRSCSSSCCYYCYYYYYSTCYHFRCLRCWLPPHYFHCRSPDVYVFSMNVSCCDAYDVRLGVSDVRDYEYRPFDDAILHLEETHKKKCQ